MLLRVRHFTTDMDRDRATGCTESDHMIALNRGLGIDHGAENMIAPPQTTKEHHGTIWFFHDAFQAGINIRLNILLRSAGQRRACIKVHSLPTEDYYLVTEMHKLLTIIFSTLVASILAAEATRDVCCLHEMDVALTER